MQKKTNIRKQIFSIHEQLCEFRAANDPSSWEFKLTHNLDKDEAVPLEDPSGLGRCAAVGRTRSADAPAELVHFRERLRTGGRHRGARAGGAGATGHAQNL